VNRALLCGPWAQSTLSGSCPAGFVATAGLTYQHHDKTIKAVESRSTASEDEIYFIAVIPEPNFLVESWSTKGDKEPECFRPAGTLREAREDSQRW
jgi:hypothetical protein